MVVLGGAEVRVEQVSADEKRVTLWALHTERKAFENDVTNPERRPRDNNDVRLQHLALVKSAIRAVEALK